MGIIKLFENFKSEENIHRLCKRLGVYEYTINSNGSINADHVNLSVDHHPLVFNSVKDFYCNNNRLKSLRGIPEKVEIDFICKYNNLTSLEGSPTKVGNIFDCSDNNLKTLKGSSGVVGIFDFFCTNNELVSLEGGPKKVRFDYICYYNSLITLKGSPDIIPGSFECGQCKLTTLEGSPRIIKRRFGCENNNIMTFDGAPDQVGEFACMGNPIENIWSLFKDWSKVELLNDYDALRIIDGEPVVIIDRLNEFLMDIGKETIREVVGYTNK